MKTKMLIIMGAILLAATWYPGVAAANGYDDQATLESGTNATSDVGRSDGSMIESYMEKEELETGALPSSEAGMSDWASGFDLGHSEIVESGGVEFRPDIDSGGGGD